LQFGVPELVGYLTHEVELAHWIQRAYASCSYRPDFIRLACSVGYLFFRDLRYPSC